MGDKAGEGLRNADCEALVGVRLVLPSQKAVLNNNKESLTSTAECLFFFFKGKGILGHITSQKRTRFWGMKSRPPTAWFGEGSISPILELTSFSISCFGKKDVICLERIYIGCREGGQGQFCDRSTFWGRKKYLILLIGYGQRSWKFTHMLDAVVSGVRWERPGGWFKAPEAIQGCQQSLVSWLTAINWLINSPV